jgi:hypothetical protein
MRDSKNASAPAVGPSPAAALGIAAAKQASQISNVGIFVMRALRSAARFQAAARIQRRAPRLGVFS